MRHILFLDIDGVLNSHSYVLRTFGWPQSKELCAEDRKRTDGERMMTEIDPTLAFNLGLIAHFVPDLEVVISSSWKDRFELYEFQDLFFKRLKIGWIKVIGMTPSVVHGQKMSEHPPRIAQIDQWRKDNGVTWAECTILDDHSVAPNIDKNSRWWPEDPDWVECFVQTDQRDGLTYSRTCEVITKLIGPMAFTAPRPDVLGF